jgi:hypothetical protein
MFAKKMFSSKSKPNEQAYFVFFRYDTTFYEYD